MALSFPANPTNGQVYTDTVTGNRYLFNSTANVWSYAANNVGVSVTSTPPSGVAEGSMWWNRDTGRMFVRYNDGTSTQWVETTPSGTIDTNLIASYTNPVFALTNSSYAVANAGFGKANTALQNTTGTFAGSLTISNPSATVLSVQANTPNRSLEVNNNGVNGVGLVLQNGGNDITWFGSAKWAIGGSSLIGDTALATNGANNLIFGTNSAERMRIGPTGQVGIGSSYFTTVSPLTITNVGKHLTLQSYGGSQNNSVSLECIRSDFTTNAASLALYTNSGTGETERMRIDHTGRVGLGLSSPTYKLSISGYVNANVANKVSIGDYADYQALLYYNSGDEGFTIENTSDYTGGSINFRINSAERVRIDTSGRVSLKYQPYFHVYDAIGSATAASTYVKNTNLTNLYYNTGSDYNTSTCRFTAPIAGKYYFYYQANLNNSSGQRDLVIYLNGSPRLRSYSAPGTSNWDHHNVSGILDMAAGDYVEFYYTGDPDAGLTWHYAGGYLLG